MQHNLPLPKISNCVIVFARQVWKYNLTFVLHAHAMIFIDNNTSNVHIYSWLETENSHAASQFGLCLIVCLDKLQSDSSKETRQQH